MEDFSRQELSQRQASYWIKAPATIDGMLGGYGFIHDVDVQGSLDFISTLFPDVSTVKAGRALDCGAGIGRITQHVLIPAGFPKVDILDVCDKFLETARQNIGHDFLGDSICSAFDDFDFMKGTRTWNLIWMQWCAIYLRDDEFVDFFARACGALSPDPKSVVVLKENFLREDDEPLPDHEDSSITRSDAHLKRLWTLAGVEVVLERNQKGLPKSIFPVRMYALRPARN